MEVKIENLKCNDNLNVSNLIIESGKITSIVGKNGSGKSLLLDIIAGLNINYEGKALITGIRKNKKEKIAYLRQDYYKDFLCSNILEDIKQYSSKLDINKLNTLLKTFNLSEDILKKTYYDISDGEAKKIFIIKQFLKNSKIMIFDDVTMNLDQSGISSVIKLLKSEKRNGKLILLTSMNSEFLLKVSDEFIVLFKDKCIKETNKYDLFSNKKLLNDINMKLPTIIDFKLDVEKRKKIKLLYRDNIDDLIKEIYRHVS